MEIFVERKVLLQSGGVRDGTIDGSDTSVKEFSHQTDEAVFLYVRGENAQWAEHPGDVSKPAYPIGRTVTFESSGN